MNITQNNHAKAFYIRILEAYLALSQHNIDQNQNKILLTKAATWL